MIRPHLASILPALASSALLCCSTPGPPLDPAATVRVVAEGFAFTEGPATSDAGDLYFTDQPGDRILRLDASGEVSTFLSPAGRSNGLYFDRAGRLLACADEHGQLWAIDLETRGVEVLIEEFEGAQLNGPNDLWVDPEGGVWFSDPFYRRPYWERTESQLDGQHVYHRSPTGVLTVAARDFERPNGIIGSADGRHLYVADIGAGQTWEFPIEGPGLLGERRLVIDQGSDGMALDDAGHLYLTGEDVTVVDVATGAVVARVDTGGRRSSNVTFRGRTLFITARDALLAIETRVADGAR